MVTNRSSVKYTTIIIKKTVFFPHFELDFLCTFFYVFLLLQNVVTMVSTHAVLALCECVICLDVLVVAAA